MKHWSWRILFGFVAVLFGVIALAVPKMTGEAVVYVFGLLLLFSSIFMLASGLIAKDTQNRRLLMLLEGLVTLIIGLLFIFWTSASLVVMVYLLAAWMLIFGILELLVGVTLPKNIAWIFGKNSKMLLFIGGLLSVIVGVLLFAFPGDGIIAVVWVVGIYAVVIGMLNLIGGMMGATST